jgi:hypothetical protein
MKNSLLVACVLAVSAAAPVLLLTDVAEAQETTALEFFVGKKLTAKNQFTTGRRVIEKGTQGTVKKVYKSGGKAVALDVEVGGSTVKLSVAVVKANFS